MGISAALRGLCLCAETGATQEPPPRVAADLLLSGARNIQTAAVRDALEIVCAGSPGARLDARALTEILCSADEAQKLSALFVLARAGVINLACRFKPAPWPCSLIERKRNLPLSPAQPSFAHLLASRGKEAPAPGQGPSLTERFRELQRAGADLELPSRAGHTPLHVALLARNLPATRALIELGANLDARDSLNFTPLMLACRARFEAGVRALLSAGAEVDAIGTQMQATALHTASISGDAACVAALIEAGARLDARNAWQLEPLHMAAGTGHADTMAVLIEHGASPNSLAGPSNRSSPLLYAAICNHANTILTLARNGANLDLGNGVANNSALHIAAAANRRYAVEALVAAGANVNSRDARGSTPLHHAASERCSDTARTLIRLGAEVTARNDAGYRPIELAGYAGDAAICMMLKRAGDDGPFTFVDRAPGGGGA